MGDLSAKRRHGHRAHWPTKWLGTTVGKRIVKAALETTERHKRWGDGWEKLDRISWRTNGGKTTRGGGWVTGT